jgi:hypothetical protein
MKTKINSFDHNTTLDDPDLWTGFEIVELTVPLHSDLSKGQGEQDATKMLYLIRYSEELSAPALFALKDSVMQRFTDLNIPGRR